jgi:hypothetical protein
MAKDRAVKTARMTNHIAKPVQISLLLGSRSLAELEGKTREEARLALAQLLLEVVGVAVEEDEGDETE